jgi:hypothetical protein
VGCARLDLGEDAKIVDPQTRVSAGQLVRQIILDPFADRI